MENKTKWQSVENVPLNIEVIQLDIKTGDVINVKYIRQPNKKRSDRYYWIDMPLLPNHPLTK